MTNERLRGAITASGLTLDRLSEQLAVDPKTVERWITKGRTPHRRHRLAAAAILGTDDTFLWPDTATDPRTQSATRAEFLEFYPNRGMLPLVIWTDLIDSARESIDLLAYAASFLHDSVPEFAERLIARADAGTHIRLLFGDPDGTTVNLRGDEEGIGDLIKARCSITRHYLTPLLRHPNITAREHDTTLYASIYRFDDTMLVNTHVYGAPAGKSPILHINRIPGGHLFTHYMQSFEATWDVGTPHPGAPGDSAA